MMKFVLFIKDDIAIVKQRRKSLDNIALGVYDRYEEITEAEFESTELPAEKIDGAWCKTDKWPVINEPEPEPTAEELLDILLGVTE